MLRFALRRFAWSVPVVLIASFLLFWAVRATFDPVAKLRQGHDPGAVQREIERLGLDRSIPEQYALWMKGFLTGDWGTSTRTGGSVSSLVGKRAVADAAADVLGRAAGRLRRAGDRRLHRRAPVLGR